MITVTVNGTEYQCAVAVKGSDFILLYDSDDAIIASFFGIQNFGLFEISGGDWTPYAIEEIIIRSATISDGLIILDDYDDIETGTTLKLIAPANSEDVTQGISINGTPYHIVNYMGEPLLGTEGLWAIHSLIAFIVDKDDRQVFLIGSSGSNAQYAPLESPTFTGTPKAPAAATDYTTYRIRNMALMASAPSGAIGNGQLVGVYE